MARCKALRADFEKQKLVLKTWRPQDAQQPKQKADAPHGKFGSHDSQEIQKVQVVAVGLPTEPVAFACSK